MNEIPTRSLIEGMLRDDATIDGAALYGVANTLGMTDQQVRLCIKRMVADGQFTVEGRGRKAVLYATAHLRSTITPELDYVRLMYAQDRGDAPWDGRWHLAAFAVPESSRSSRDALRDRIIRLGGAPLQGGLYVSPHAWEEKINAAATEFGVAGHITTLTTTNLSIAGTKVPRDIALRLWPLDEVDKRHRMLLAFAEPALSALQHASVTERTTIAIALATEFNRALDPDPLLPPELLPQPWIGAGARAAAAACWRELLKSDAPQRMQLFQWYSDVIQEIT
ncbi:PaaX family transcriptional regulator C-terminal domain-containing protein [Mycobacteroides chelonae]|uniref:PaaX family transcriptional regulator C-terminal domain-containing protein n=1 Tax=Mycobacteroides chelonae TaxID=1774 RepID=UPI0009BCEA22|nr:PaaX family transcriptional regulator C-terminal domain-containing protein [Mycobacteroides chelonae]